MQRDKQNGPYLESIQLFLTSKSQFTTFFFVSTYFFNVEINVYHGFRFDREIRYTLLDFLSWRKKK